MRRLRFVFASFCLLFIFALAPAVLAQKSGCLPKHQPKHPFYFYH